MFSDWSSSGPMPRSVSCLRVFFRREATCLRFCGRVSKPSITLAARQTGPMVSNSPLSTLSLPECLPQSGTDQLAHNSHNKHPTALSIPTWRGGLPAWARWSERGTGETKGRITGSIFRRKPMRDSPWFPSQAQSNHGHPPFRHRRDATLSGNCNLVP